MPKTFSLIPTTLALLFLLCATVAIEGQAREAASEEDEGVVVSMRERKFQKSTVTIKVGDPVKWLNEDEHDHTVVADDASFKSENISPGESYTFTFKKAGRFAYTCTYHPRMKGTIIVQE